jgi:hypothetical protein
MLVREVSQQLTIRWPMHASPTLVSGFTLPTLPHLSRPNTPKAPHQHVPQKSMTQVTSTYQDSHIQPFISLNQFSGTKLVFLSSEIILAFRLSFSDLTEI